jgi:hypothetical protein
MDIYPAIIHEGGPLTKQDNDVDSICKEIHDACRGFGTDEL